VRERQTVILLPGEASRLAWASWSERKAKEKAQRVKRKWGTLDEFSGGFA
jgi:hypothetical protein